MGTHGYAASKTSVDKQHQGFSAPDATASVFEKKIESPFTTLVATVADQQDS